MRGNGRPQQGGQGRPGQGGNGRPDNRGEGRFGGNNRGGQRAGGGRRDNDAVFTPELTKTSRTARESVTERIRTKRKILRKIPVQVTTDRIRAEEEIFPEFRKLFRNLLLSQNRKRRNQK